MSNQPLGYGISDVNLGRGFAVACYKCYAGRIKPSSIPYQTTVTSKKIQEDDVSANLNVTFSRGSEGLMTKARELIIKKYSLSSQPMKAKIRPFYLLSRLLIERQTAYDELGASLTEADLVGIRSTEDLMGALERLAAQPKRDF